MISAGQPRRATPSLPGAKRPRRVAGRRQRDGAHAGAMSATVVIGSPRDGERVRRQFVRAIDSSLFPQ